MESGFLEDVRYALGRNVGMLPAHAKVANSSFCEFEDDMTESTWHASCLKHRCLVAMVSFDGPGPAYHRISLPHECSCAVGTLTIHHMSHSPLQATKVAEQQVGELRKALSDLYGATSDCTKHSCQGLRNSGVTLRAHTVLEGIPKAENVTEQQLRDIRQWAIDKSKELKDWAAAHPEHHLYSTKLSQAVTVDELITLMAEKGVEAMGFHRTHERRKGDHEGKQCVGPGCLRCAELH